MAVEVKTERQGDILVAEAEGRIDGVTARDFEDAVKSAIGDGDGSLVLDLSGVSYISSAGLRAILLIAKDMKNRDGQFSLCELSAPIKEVFQISGFDKILTIADSRAEATAAVSS